LNKGESLDFKELHKWPSNPKDAVIIQKELNNLIINESCFENLEYITAVDTAYNNDTNRLYSSVVTMKYPELNEAERAIAEGDITFPYIPSLLGFREGPVILSALSKLIIKPDLIIFAGHGIAHPLSFGIASHLGLLFDTPSIGCARKCLIGQYDEPGEKQGQYNSISIANVECGFAYRSRIKVKPIFISPGYKCSLDDSLKVIVSCLTNYRMPHPLRLAHLYANKYRRANKNKIKTLNNNYDNRDKEENILST